MNEKDLEVKYLVLKVSDINERLTEASKDTFWYYVKVITGGKL